MADRTNGLNNIDIGAGRRGFRNRNLGLGQAGTVVDAEWANGIQEEIVRAIELLGLAPDAGNREQLIQAMRRIAGGNTTVLSATGALTADNAGIVSVNAAGGALTLTLPAANAASGRPVRFTFLRTDTSANAVTIQRAGADTIEGLAALTLPVNRRLTLQSDGASAWRLIGAGGALLNVQVLGVSGTYVPTPGMGFVIVTGVGGGGAGGGVGVASPGNVSLGAPGAAGAAAQAIFTAAQVGASVTVTIGPGGTPVVGGVGGNGGSTSFGSLLTCPGGPGGGLSNNTAIPNLNANGIVSGASLGANLWQELGGSEGFSFALSGSGGAGGPGGRSFFGIGTPPVGFNAAAVAGVSPGSGGSGIAVGSGVGPFGGGAGAAGRLIIEEYSL